MYFFYTKLSFTEFILRAQFAILFSLTNLYNSFGCMLVETDESNIAPALRAAITTSLQKYLGDNPRYVYAIGDGEIGDQYKK
tara:strand:+ start:341 stop:586 length:246 start_codon:yes stop_codon:yes gene_type:complete